MKDLWFCAPVIYSVCNNTSEIDYADRTMVPNTVNLDYIELLSGTYPGSLGNVVP